MPAKEAHKISASVPINLRIPREAQLMIDRAAKLSGKNRTEFMVEAAMAAAEDKLLDQAFIALDAETYAQFLDVLDRGPEPEGYKRLMSAPSPWDP